METMRDYRNTSITCIERVENGIKHETYEVQRKNIAMDITKTTAPADADRFVRWLFHGTEQENIDKIVNSQVTGYLPMLYGSEVGAIWGSGTYFARDAQHSHNYTERKNDEFTGQIQRKMFLNRVIVGDWDKAAPEINKFPWPRLNSMGSVTHW